MTQQSRRKTGYMVYFPPEILEEIERRAEHGKRSQWIVEAVREKLDRERDRMRTKESTE